MKKTITLFFLFCFISISAHEFWLQPDKFIYKIGDTAVIKLMVGEDFNGENWNGDSSKVASLGIWNKKGKAQLVTDYWKEGDSLIIKFTPEMEEGSCMIIFNSTNSYISLEASKFNAYLEEDGLRNAIEYRRDHNETDSSGHEVYQRSAKTIIQVGKKYDSSFMRQTELPLDIVPLNHPLLIPDRQKMFFKVFFNNNPLPEQLIKIWYKENGKTIKEELLTDADGVVSFRLKKSGTWMVSTVKMIRATTDPKAQWQSHWGSCTWGYQ
ncbi:MAG TPA: DUF4198 domain-containing protein [Chitinophagaceae bacterium]|nr:DUF4198 domain-containing protein [Chitinophagaceae bacterium]